MPDPIRACRDCGKTLKGRAPVALFCNRDCRQAFNRRRRDRGAELYDFVMQGDKETAGRLCEAYRSADLALRAGRPSWNTLEQALMGLPAGYGDHGDGRTGRRSGKR